MTNASPPRLPQQRFQYPTRWERERAARGGKAEHDSDPAAIGPWVLGDTVGKGASGRVRIARHAYNGKMAAVKIVPVDPSFTSKTDIPKVPEYAAKMLQAAEREMAMMKLLDHPNIMSMYDVWSSPGELFFVLEYVNGGELFDYLCSRSSRLPLEEVVELFKQVLAGVDYCHRFNVCHRDLKPENILLTSREAEHKVIKIADFGMSTLDKLNGLLNTSCGSPHYASPEIVMGLNYEGAMSDIWSCGVILFALVTSRLPFDDPNVGKVLGKVRDGKYTMPEGVPAIAADLIQRILTVDIHQRITMREILRHPLLKIATPGIAIVPPPTVEALSTPYRLVDLDPDLLYNLAIIFRRGQNQLIASLTSNEENWEKSFYFLLEIHRDRAFENYNMGDDLEDYYAIIRSPGSIKRYFPGRIPAFICKSGSPGPQPSPISATFSPPPARKEQRRERPPAVAGPRPPSTPSSPAKASRHRPDTIILGSNPPRLMPQPVPAASRQPWQKGTQISGYTRIPRPTATDLAPDPPPRYEPTTVHGLGLRINPPQNSPLRAPELESPAQSSLPQPSHLFPNPTLQRGAEEIIAKINQATLEQDQRIALALQRKQQQELPIAPDVNRLSPPKAQVHSGRAVFPTGRVRFRESEPDPVYPINATTGSVSRPRARSVGPESSAPMARQGSDKENRPVSLGDPVKVKAINMKDRDAVTAPGIHDTPRGIYTPNSPAKGSFLAAVSANAKVNSDKRSSAFQFKTRPPPLDLTKDTVPRHPERQQHSPLFSPLLGLGIVAAGAATTGRGFFAKLFDWKTPVYHLFSVEDIHATREACYKLLQSFGVMVLLEDSEGRGVLKCRVDDTYDAYGDLVFKQVRFKVEFAPFGMTPTSPPWAGSGFSNVNVGGGSAFGTPILSPIHDKMPTPPPGIPVVSIVTLSQERGALSTFRALHSRLRDSWKLDKFHSPTLFGGEFSVVV